MNAKSTAPRKGCITKHVRKLVLDTPNVSEQEFLAAMTEVIGCGGRIIVEVPGRKILSWRKAKVGTISCRAWEALFGNWPAKTCQ